MQISGVCRSYFNGFHELYDWKNNSAQMNAAAALKVLTYFTVVIPLAFAGLYVVVSLCDRVSSRSDAALDLAVDDHARGAIGVSNLLSRVSNQPSQPTQIYANSAAQGIPSGIIQTAESTVVRVYPGDLTAAEKVGITTQFLNNDTILNISFPNRPQVAVTIRKQDIFQSGAEVIVNAANTHLGGGGGIDGLIHGKGGPDYAAAHRELQAQYRPQSNRPGNFDAQYTCGYAAMIRSGALKASHVIDSVIVIAGPQGATSPQKESELYSCYYNSLLLAHSQNKTKIAFPSISTGIFAFPRDRAAAISSRAIFDFTRDFPESSVTTISIHMLDSAPRASLEQYQAAL